MRELCREGSEEEVEELYMVGYRIMGSQQWEEMGDEEMGNGFLHQEKGIYIQQIYYILQ